MREKRSIPICEDARNQAIAALQTYFAEHMDEEIGGLKGDGSSTAYAHQ